MTMLTGRKGAPARAALMSAFILVFLSIVPAMAHNSDASRHQASSDGPAHLSLQ